jgi:hypothetical protein
LPSGNQKRFWRNSGEARWTLRQRTVIYTLRFKMRLAINRESVDSWSIYTRDELRTLVEQHRQHPFTVAELLRLHQAKRMFGGRIAFNAGKRVKPGKSFALAFHPVL